MKHVSQQPVPEYLRGGRFEHLAGVLDENPSWIVRQLISILSAKVQIDEDVVARISRSAETGPVVYAMKYRSIYDLHFLRVRFAELGLPVPAFAFETSASGTGSLSKFFRVWRARLAGMIHERRLPDPVDEEVLREILERGGAGVLFLVDEKTSRSRYVHPERDPIRILLDLQGRVPGSIALVPLMILYDRTPRRVIRPFWESFLGDPDRPGPLKRILTWIRQWTVPELLVGDPVHLLSTFEEFGGDRSWEDLPFEVRGQLIASINARIRVNRGPEKLSRTEIKERVLQDQRLHRAVRESVAKEGTTEEKVRKKAESFVDEIAANQSIQAAHFLYYLLRWIFSRIFAGIDLRDSDFSMLKSANAEGSLILVSCHKSHFDYLLTGYLSFVNQMAIPHIAAGKNLSFWPVGPILRKGGAFFLRRSFKGLSLYTHVFAAYVKVLVKEKFNISFYMEGGRSRTGKLLPPKVGLLAFLLQAVDEGAVADLSFVPTFIGYDQIPEEDSYLRELAGKEKKKESIFSVIRARTILEQSFGRAYVRFHHPISYKDFCRKWKNHEEAAALSGKESRRLLNDFAYHLMHGIVRSGVVTPVDLTAAGLVCSGKRRVPHRLLVKAVDAFSRVLRHEGVDFAESLEHEASAVETAIGLFTARGFLTSEGNGPPAEDEPLYTIDEEKRGNLEFYKNSLVNCLWPASFLAAVFIKHDHGSAEITPAMREDFLFLADLFSKELILDPLVTNDEVMTRTLEIFVKNGWVGSSEEAADKGRDIEVLECLRGVLGDLLELYYLVLAAADKVSGEGVSQKEFFRSVEAMAQQCRPEGQGFGTPHLPTITLANALGRFNELGIVDYSYFRKLISGLPSAREREKLKWLLAGSLTGRISVPDESV